MKRRHSLYIHTHIHTIPPSHSPTHSQVEMPIAIVLAHMEMAGMPVDRSLIEAEREPLRRFVRQVCGGDSGVGTVLWGQWCGKWCGLGIVY